MLKGLLIYSLGSELATTLIAIDTANVKIINDILINGVGSVEYETFAGIFIQPVDVLRSTEGLQMLLFKDPVPKKQGVRRRAELSTIFFAMMYLNKKDIRIKGTCRLTFSGGRAKFNTFTAQFKDPTMEDVKYVGNLLPEKIPVEYEEFFSEENRIGKVYTFDNIIEMAQGYLS